MEIGYILNELWRLRAWVAVGVVIATVAALSTVYSLPGFEKKTLEMGSASTELLIDSSQSPIGDLGAPIENLTVRAALYPRVIESTEVKAEVARVLGISPVQISTTGAQPDTQGEEQTGREPTEDQRANELIAEGSVYRLSATASTANPLLQIAGQADTAEKAIRLVKAATNALRRYVLETQERQDIPESQRVELRNLGAVTGGVINEGVDRAAAVLTWIAAFVFWCLLLLVTRRVLSSLRAARRADRDMGEWLFQDVLSPNRDADQTGSNGQAAPNGHLADEPERDPISR
jgi:hypothetical protein